MTDIPLAVKEEPGIGPKAVLPDLMKRRPHSQAPEPQSRIREIEFLPRPLRERVQSFRNIRNGRTKEQIEIIEKHFALSGAEGASIFRFLNDPEDIQRVIETLSFLDGYHTRDYKNGLSFLTGESLRSLERLADFRDRIVYLPASPTEERVENLVLREKINLRVQGQLKELVKLVNQIKEGTAQLSEDDLVMATASFNYLIGTIDWVPLLQTGGFIPEFSEAIDPKMARDILHFPTRHPELPNIFASCYELLLTYQMYHQKSAPYAGMVEQAKTEFYQQLAEVNEDYPTASAELDLERGLSIFTEIEERLKKEGMSLSESTVCFAGCGKGERFESPLIMRLKERGITLGKVIGLDLRAFPTPQGFDEFVQGDFSKLGELYPNQLDIVYLGASPLSDILEKRKLGQAFETFHQALRAGGSLVWDGPVPLGDPSYAKTIVAYAREHPFEPLGMMLKVFETQTGSCESLFYIPYLEETLQFALEKGFVPENFPPDPSKRAVFYQKVEDGDVAMGEAAYDATKPETAIYRTGENTRMTCVMRKVGEKDVRSIFQLEPDLLTLLMQHSQLKQAA